ncbi:phosphate-binding protein [Lysinibacillus sp. 2017]|uniref:PstS family phosphate ABC transporter substrate-binding protein n=1 Tax=unclassified Lysinibacillus TaxID=2636778 RepID=UPI000D52961A|nr:MULTISPECIES: PstS family phosphate ABC transporter substrate-binding protein [unclassified Lysinibacillus]AWE08045.1 phosphate-binding protein [Lysinibacillus sp. 2017]TGN36448.1 PstS family phosphate ABC transporter substrate-binding protein [Lysinibacillus sp. S2017]
MKKWQYLTSSALLCSALFLGACGEENDASSAEGTTDQSESGNVQLSGSVTGDGSSTVAPITEAIVEEYAAVQKDVRVAVGVSGTGGGFEKFINGETDFSNASRPIKDSEIEELAAAGIEFTEFEIAYDGLSVVVHPENTWAKDLTVEQLKQIWIEDGTTKKWSDIDPSWPAEEIVFYSPGSDSGTYDYFDEVILDGEDIVKAATLSEDDNVLVQGVTADKNAIGYFGYAYYLENKDKLQVVSVDGIKPTNETIESGEYSPLSRPLFVYVKNSAIKENEATYDFIKFTLEHAGEMAEVVGYVSLPAEKYKASLEDLEGLK